MLSDGGEKAAEILQMIINYIMGRGFVCFNED
jgi:hypothetical protein